MVDVIKDQFAFDFARQKSAPPEQKRKDGKDRARQQIMSPEESARLLGIKPPSAYREED